MLSITRNALIPLTLRKKIGKCAGAGPSQDFQIRMFDCNYHGTTGIHMDDKIWRYGLHEAATVRLMRARLAAQKAAGRKTVFMDVGTNSGMYILAAADLADQVFGFEPWQTVREKAERNIASNNLSHVILFPFGLSDVQADLPFSPPAENNLGVGSFVQNAGVHTVTLQVRRGDDVAGQYNIHPTLIKMDIEGHEKKALTGLHATLKRCKPDVIFEYSAGSRQDLGNYDTLRALFGEEYIFEGIKRSRERPALEPFNPAKKYENVLARYHV